MWQGWSVWGTAVINENVIYLGVNRRLTLRRLKLICIWSRDIALRANRRVKVRRRHKGAKNSYICILSSCPCYLYVVTNYFFYSTVGGIGVLQNVGQYLPDCKASHNRIYNFSRSLPQGLQTSHCFICQYSSVLLVPTVS